MEVRELALPGLLEIRPKVYSDERGYFFESYNEEVFHRIGINVKFVQDNQSFSKKGVVRGLHFQSPPSDQGKLVRVVSGRVLDVALDIRRESPTYGSFFSIELSDKEQNMLYIPPGFAHGFSALTDCIFHYKCTNVYNHLAENGINPLDSEIGIDWQVVAPVVSAKDQILQPFSKLKSPF